MSAISLQSSLSYRPTQGATLPSAQQVQRGTTYGSFGAARGGNNANASSTYCPTCGGNASAGSSSYCPTCNRTGGTQSNITNTGVRMSTTQTGAQGGRICVGCAYQGR